MYVTTLIVDVDMTQLCQPYQSQISFLHLEKDIIILKVALLKRVILNLLRWHQRKKNVKMKMKQQLQPTVRNRLIIVY